MSQIKSIDSQKEQKLKEAYFTAGQGQLIWARFKKQKAAMVGAFVLIFLILSGIFAPFLTPYDPTIAGRNETYLNGAPQIPKFCDENGCSFRPFIYSFERSRSMATNFRWVTEINRDERRYVEFFVEGSEYKYFNFNVDLPGDVLDFRIPGLTFNTHLFGVDEGMIHIFGTDATGKDIFSRTLHAINTSLAVGTIGVFIAFVLALAIGGLSGYYGGWIDSSLQMLTDAVRTIPGIPLFMAIAAFIPDTWSAEMRFFVISMILGFIGWPTLARRVRTHLLTERNQEYVLAAQLCGASAGHVIRRHLLPSFTSYIIVDLIITFPYMVLSETALSFIGLGLKDPVNSLGVMLQSVTNADVMLNYQWYFIPVVVFIMLVLAFVFVGDGLRDAADPYGDAGK
ncbi:Oligopeptide transport system permease protein OppC (TC 3.A.1.5.1) [hydrothermal vent metagenome]|uniref:Oligopeptide transport system permease protein OppC (TC 3.A.1.5.1) n=1 Tax=hydrothermal vent metagenome TaxID=652676 RepID=A0A3B0UGD1_9ZZZZ